MSPIAKPFPASAANPSARLHPGDACWSEVMAQLNAVFASRGIHPARAIVLLPYAQLMQEASTAWIAHAMSAGLASSFVPRFETTMNWATGEAARAGGFMSADDDIALDIAIDGLTASRLLERAGLAAQQGALAGRLVEAAWSLARVAAAQPPEARLSWAAGLADELGAGLESSALALELAVARIALVWAGASSYPTDVLFSASPDLLVVLQGFQSEPIAEALAARFDARAVAIKIPFPVAPGTLALHAAQDAEDEAQRAAACVVSHLAQGRTPVALIAQDRVLTRRVRAMLAECGVALRDETGWKLSTTRAAATLIGLLRALPWDASSDSVLDWLKNAPAFNATEVVQFETALRKSGVRLWRDLPDGNEDTGVIATQIERMRAGLQRRRPLAAWLADLRLALEMAGQWQPLLADAAGAAVVDCLRLEQGGDTGLPAGVRMDLQEFTNWASQALEGASFSPAHPAQAQVVIIPLSQLLGRPLRAVVMPGADEVRLAVSPEPPGMWTPGQRERLGLPSRDALTNAARMAWEYALRMPHIDVLWRTSEAGEKLMPSGFVQEVLLMQRPIMAGDPRIWRAVVAMPTPCPTPSGAAIPIHSLSASGYEDLRRCPYRFFALRQLKLQEAEELESEVGKREFGNWLHTLLNSFHEALKEAPDPDAWVRIAMINIASEDARASLGLSQSEFLPFAAIWPRVRDGYLEWLAAHEASGAQYLEGESWKEMTYGDIALVGKLDRIDHLADGRSIVMDYKTEARTTTQARIRDGQEDTQLAFYAALLADDTLAASYVNLGEKEATKTYDQPHIVHLRDELINSILLDVSRISAGAPLPALGEGKACDYCSARGLCRKDFWS